MLKIYSEFLNSDSEVLNQVQAFRAQALCIFTRMPVYWPGCRWFDRQPLLKNWEWLPCFLHIYLESTWQFVVSSFISHCFIPVLRAVRKALPWASDLGAFGSWSAVSFAPFWFTYFWQLSSNSIFGVILLVKPGNLIIFPSISCYFLYDIC